MNIAQLIASVQGLSAIAAGLFIGLAAMGTAIGFGILGGSFWKVWLGSLNCPPC